MPIKSTDNWHSALDKSEMVAPAFIDLRKALDTVDYSLLCRKLEGMRSEMTSCVGLCLILQVESNFVELMGQAPRLIQLTLEYLKARVLVLSYSLSISMNFLKPYNTVLLACMPTMLVFTFVVLV